MAKAPDPRIPPGTKPGTYLKGIGTVSIHGTIIPDPKKETPSANTTANTSLAEAIETGKGPLTAGCAVANTAANNAANGASSNTAPKKSELSETANKVINAANTVQQEVADVKNTLLAIIVELEYVTDCEALKARVRPVIKSVTDAIDGVINEMERQSGPAKLLKPPSPTPWSIIKWLKKLVLGTILPSVKAMIKLAQEVILLIKTLKALLKVIKGLRKKLEDCAVEFAKEAIDDVIGAIEKEINQVIDKALGPLFCKIQKIQADIDKAVGFSTEQIDFSSTENFIKSTSTAIEAKEDAVRRAQEEANDETPAVSTTMTDSAGTVYEFRDGILTKVTPAGP